MRLRLAFAATAGLLCLAAVACSRQGSSALSAALQASLEGPKPPAFVGKSEEASRLWKDVQRFYKRRAYQPAWLSGSKTRGRASELVAEAAKAEAEGLDAADYDVGESAALAERDSSWNPLKRDKLESEQAVSAELRLSYVFMKYASHLLVGRVDPHALDKEWVGQTRRAELPELLEQALAGRGFAAAFEGLRPRHPQYALLKQALQREREMAAQGGSPANLPGAARSKPGARTVVPVQERIRQIELNLERWRWLPEDLGSRYVMVNIPAFKLQAMDGGRPALEMRVVTGTREDPTPILADQMTHVIFSPYWNIPPTIAREEWMPKLRQNPDYLAQHGVEVVKGSRVVDPSSVDWNDEDLRLRQRPGSKNALGFVKFAFPNRFNVYLHDTPNDSVFYRTSRDLSHGCVRVEKPLELAEWVLRGQSEWTRDKIEAAMHAGSEKHVKLEQAIPVYLVYQTVWSAEDGTLVFVEDLYGHDARQLALLEGGPV